MVEFPGATAVKITFDALTKLEVMCASEGSVTIKLHSFADMNFFSLYIGLIP